MDIEKLKDWRDGARRGLGREVDHLREKEEQLSGYIQVLDATEELVAEIDNLNEELERRQSEIDDLSEQLEQKEAELYALRQQLQGEIDALRSQLLDLKERKLADEKKLKPMEIHNHFEQGSSSQVFNDQVNGRFSNKSNDKKKKEKKRWKKIVRKVL